MKLHKSGTFGKEDRYGGGYITFDKKARSQMWSYDNILKNESIIYVIE
ncbi:hypothetical protein [Peribacillus frigoritolerans]